MPIPYRARRGRRACPAAGPGTGCAPVLRHRAGCAPAARHRAGRAARPRAGPRRRPSAVAAWLDEERPAARPGVWRLGHRPKEAPEKITPVTIAGLLIPLVLALGVWSLWERGYLPYKGTILRMFSPNAWWWPLTVSSPRPVEGWSPGVLPGEHYLVVADGVFFGLLVCAVAMLGSWRAILRHYMDRLSPPVRVLASAGLALFALSLVFPEAFPVVGWSAVPVVDPLLSLFVLFTDSYDLMASTLFTYTLYTVVTLLVVWPFARLGNWRAYARELLDRQGPEAAAPGAGRPSAPAPTGPCCGRRASTTSPTCSPPRSPAAG